MGQNFKEQNYQARHMVWPWPSLAKKEEKQKMSRTPSGLALPGKGQNFKENEKYHARHMVWPRPSSAKKEKQNMSRTPCGLAVIAIGKKIQKQKASRTKYGLAVTVI
jgi:hypothetical protein